MKKFYFTLLAALLFSLKSLAADTVYVHGYVMDLTGAPAANVTVVISPDSIASPACHGYYYTYTNQNGYYNDTIYCSSSIAGVHVAVMSCNGSGSWTVIDKQVPPTKIVEANFPFTVCPPQPGCHADFMFGVQQTTVNFQSTSTTSSGSSLSYKWSFGDGTTSTTANPVHNYNAGGTFNVKLLIESSSGCKDSVMKVVTITANTGTCHAQFRDSFVAPNKFFFFSGGSTASTGSTITQRIWSFGDGSYNTANNENVDHIYQQSGTYNVCLRILTSSGCMDSVCKTITIPPSTTVSCHAQFADSVIGNKFYGLSGASTASTASTIISRLWSFGDGTYNTGNNVNVDHIYQQNGTYNICLKIFTSGGCADSICKTISISGATPPPCHAYFSYQLGANGVVTFTNNSTTLGTNTQYYWSFGNGIFATSINATYQYQPGTYNACLRIYNSACMDSICKTITIAPPPPPTNCEAVFAFTGLPANSSVNGYTLQFSSANSHATSAAGDSIYERIWIWGDGTTTGGKVVSPTHTYATAGTYNVCLVIRSASGCSDTTCKTINLPMPNQLVCNAQFSYENLPVTTTVHREVRFNSTTSSAGPGDSIISRKWTFGDGTTATTTNAITSHVYTQPGTYTVCLTITTALGCTKTECKTVIVTQVSSACVPHFTWQRTGAKQVSFNSSMSWVPLNDTIIERKWLFGDGSPVLTGNIVSPVHNYLNNGIYTVQLKIRTVKNCEQTFTTPVILQDSINTPPTVEPIKIISIYPNPATIQVQTVVWSQFNNVQAELAIYDVYGVKKWSVTKVLLQGSNITVLPTALLMPGPYYFRVTTSYGVKSRPFFKRN